MEDTSVEEAELEPLPPWVSKAAPAAPGVPSLQDLICSVLAQHLHEMESLDYLPDHLASSVRAAIQRDRRLLGDNGIGIWLESVAMGGTARRLNLRWASKLTNVALVTLSQGDSWCANLLELDLGFCEGIGDEGLQALAPTLRSLRTLTLTGCTSCGDKGLISIGRNVPSLERLEAELLHRVTDHGIQAIVRGCKGALGDLRIGGCTRITSVSTSLIADHLAPKLSRLGVGGLSSLTDLDMEDVGRCRALTWLDLCACPKLCAIMQSLEGTSLITDRSSPISPTRHRPLLSTHS